MHARTEMNCWKSNKSAMKLWRDETVEHSGHSWHSGTQLVVSICMFMFEHYTVSGAHPSMACNCRLCIAWETSANSKSWHQCWSFGFWELRNFDKICMRNWKRTELLERIGWKEVIRRWRKVTEGQRLLFKRTGWRKLVNNSEEWINALYFLGFKVF